MTHYYSLNNRTRFYNSLEEKIRENKEDLEYFAIKAMLIAERHHLKTADGVISEISELMQRSQDDADEILSKRYFPAINPEKKDAIEVYTLMLSEFIRRAEDFRSLKELRNMISPTDDPLIYSESLKGNGKSLEEKG